MSGQTFHISPDGGIAESDEVQDQELMVGFVGPGLMDELAEAVQKHRVMVTISFMPYDDEDES